MRKMLASAADFPDPVIRLIPDCLEMRDERAFERPTGVICFKPGAPGDIQGIQNFTVDVELKLVGRGVANPNRSRSFITWEPRYFKLHEPALASNTVHDLQIIRTAGDRSQQPLAPRSGLSE